MKLRLGIVGLGLIWENIHMPILMDMKEQFEIKAFCVHNEKKIPLWQQRLPGAAAYTDYRRMVQDSSVDAVVVTTPLEMNAEVTLAALEAGKDVFCEKPMAVHVDVADRIMEMEKQTGKTVYVLEQFLYNPQLPVMKKIIDGKQLGEFVSFERTTHYLMDSSNEGYGQTQWRRKSDFPLGHIYDGGVHEIALLNELFGMPEEMYAVGQSFREEMGKYDHILTMFHYPSGATGVCSHSAFLACSNNYFYIRFTEGSLYVYGDKLVLEHKNGGTEELNTAEGNTYRAMWMELARIVSGHGKLPFTAQDAKNCVRVLDAVEQSIESDQCAPVK